MRNHRWNRITDANAEVCIIGGGATGSGCALDAQLRGLDTLLVEAADFASGASSASTKMVHGGVRYLQEAVNSVDIQQYRLVRHALAERIAMLRNAPYLTRPLEFVIPCFSRWQQLYYGTGVKAYDWIAGSGRLLPSRFLAGSEALRRLPVLSGRTTSAVSYSDGQFDDARYNLALIDSFVRAGGRAFNYARVSSFETDSSGKLTAAIVADQLTGETFRVQAGAFINATGPYSDTVRQLASPEVSRRMRPSKGVHLLFPLDGFPDDTALLVPKTEDGRVIFAIPWLGRLLVGTTDDAAEIGAPMVVTREEVDYLLRQLNPYLARPLEAGQIVSAFAGIRPLVSSPQASDTKTLIRDDEVEIDPDTGLISILGGKWTTYRLMAERTIDRVEQALGRPHVQCRTREHPISGSDGYRPDFWRTLLDRIPEPSARHLASKYGANATAVLDLVSADPALAEPLAKGLPQLRAQVVYAARQEMAVTLEDVLARRLGLQLYGWREALAAAPDTAAILASELGWTAAREAQALEQYTAEVRSLQESCGIHSLTSK